MVRKNMGGKNRSYKLSTYKRWLLTEPCLVAVFLDIEGGYDYVKDVQATGACIQNLLWVTQGLGKTADGLENLPIIRNYYQKFCRFRTV